MAVLLTSRAVLRVFCFFEGGIFGPMSQPDHTLSWLCPCEGLSWAGFNDVSISSPPIRVLKTIFLIIFRPPLPTRYEFIVCLLFPLANLVRNCT